MSQTSDASTDSAAEMVLDFPVVPIEPAPVPSHVYRHKLPVRAWHWINAAALVTLFLSGLMIFNAHPRLYWGHYGANALGAPDPAWLEIGPNGAGQGEVRLPGAGITVPTDGILGRAEDATGTSRTRAFPYWMTLPWSYDLAGARAFHFFAAWFFGVGFLLFFLWSLVSRHASRDLTPKLKELGPRHLLHEIWEHARLRFPTGLAAARFNTLQRISYFLVILVAIPLMIFSGLAMSPAMDANWPFIVDAFGGRQTARSVHFIICWGLFAFTVVHLIMVVLAGPINEIRSMITGWFKLPPDRPAPVAQAEGAAA
jgi:thiosulfate reductase cytochrome b subunit